MHFYFYFFCLSGGRRGLQRSSFTGANYKTDGEAGAEKWWHPLWWPAGGRGETTRRGIKTITTKVIIHHILLHHVSLPANRSFSGRGSSPCLWPFIQPHSSRTSMMPSSLRSASATMATSSTTPASLWPPPPSSAGQCLMVMQKAETDSILWTYLTALLLCGKNA